MSRRPWRRVRRPGPAPPDRSWRRARASPTPTTRSPAAPTRRTRPLGSSRALLEAVGDHARDEHRRIHRLVVDEWTTRDAPVHARRAAVHGEDAEAGEERPAGT